MGVEMDGKYYGRTTQTGVDNKQGLDKAKVVHR